MDHCHDELIETEEKESETRAKEQEKRGSVIESDLLLPVKVHSKGDQGNLPLDGAIEENEFFNDSWGNPLYDFEELSEAGSIGSISSYGSVGIPDTTARLKDHSNDYRRNFQQSKHSRHLQAFKYSEISTSVRSNDREYFMETCTGLKSFSQIPGELPGELTAPPAITTLKRAVSAPVEGPSPPTFMVAKSGSRRRRPLASLQRENLMESLTWFSFHTPKCVLEDLISHELKKSEETFNISIENNCSTTQRGSKSSTSSDNDNGSLSSLSDDESDEKGDTNCMDAHSNLNQVDARDEIATDIVLPKHLPYNTLRMPYNVKRDCALVIVDISGFTKLSTILDEESLSKVSGTIVMNH